MGTPMILIGFSRIDVMWCLLQRKVSKWLILNYLTQQKDPNPKSITEFLEILEYFTQGMYPQE